MESKRYKYGQSLSDIVSSSENIKHVAKNSLECGDYVLAMTNNSVYKIRKAEENMFEVSGGWFDRKGMSPSKINIRGCTWGGSVINIGMVAACGLCLEFGNNLITTPIQKIVVIKADRLN
ncbi:MAG: hypothetical protein H6627_08610 [Calditrichae bacterium]|nr:hypothetical protein [Calditrichota bacterium]MCB9058613.1 hypothetical protein [Calditrichia bacterium]